MEEYHRNLFKDIFPEEWKKNLDKLNPDSINTEILKNIVPSGIKLIRNYVESGDINCLRLSTFKHFVHFLDLKQDFHNRTELACFDFGIHPSYLKQLKKDNYTAIGLGKKIILLYDK